MAKPWRLFSWPQCTV